MLINLVGGDGSGKTTQITLLREWIEATFRVPVRLVSKGSTFDRARFPEAEMWRLAYEEIADRVVPLMPGESRALFQVYLMALAVGHYPPMPNEVVLADGYWIKNYATEVALGIDPAWLRQVGAFFPVPDVTLLLDVEPERVVGRGLTYKPYECGLAPECDHRSFIEYQRRVLGFLRELAIGEGWAVVDGRGTEAEVAAAICGVLHGPLAARFSNE